MSARVVEPQQELVGMNGRDEEHEACVDAMIAHVDPRASVRKRVEILQQALDRVWQRAHRTLGALTLAALGERVLSAGVDLHPVLRAARVEDTGFRCEGLARTTGSLAGERVTDALRYLLVAMLTLLDRLSGAILTPALHEEVGHVRAGATDRSTTRRRRQRTPKKRGSRQ